MLSSFIALWLADIALTLMFVKQYGVDMEANPLMHRVLVEGGSIGFIAVKTAVLLPLVPLHKHISKWIYAGLVLVMIPVIIMNTQVVFGL